MAVGALPPLRLPTFQPSSSPTRTSSRTVVASAPNMRAASATVMPSWCAGGAWALSKRFTYRQHWREMQLHFSTSTEVEAQTVGK
jgi:hypothetical protein